MGIALLKTSLTAYAVRISSERFAVLCLEDSLKKF
jgi:hypothetical protein